MKFLQPQLVEKIRKEMKAEFVVDDAGGLRHSPVSLTAPERMTMVRMQLDCVSCTVGGVFYSWPVYRRANGLGQEGCSQNE